MTFRSCHDVAAFALTLPATAASTSYGQPGIKTCGKLIRSTGHEPGSFHVAAPHDEQAVLLDSDFRTLWQMPHDAASPSLLVRYGSIDPARIRIVIARAWRGRATKAQQASYGARP